MATARPSAIHPVSLRHVWLAGLGLVSVAHREALAGRERLTAALARTRRCAATAVAEMPDALRGTLGRIEPLAMKLTDEVQTRLGPLLARIGAGAKPARRATRTAPRGARRASKRGAK